MTPESAFAALCRESAGVSNAFLDAIEMHKLALMARGDPVTVEAAARAIERLTLEVERVECRELPQDAIDKLYEIVTRAAGQKMRAAAN